MTSELRPALAVWQEAYGVWGDPSLPDTSEADQAAAAVIEAYGDQREAKFKALAETLAGELQQIEVDAMEYYNEWIETGCDRKDAIRFAFGLGEETRHALTSYKEQRDAS